MVEILPYVDDDDNEDQFTWIPLSSQAKGYADANEGSSGSKSGATANAALARSTQWHNNSNSDDYPNSTTPMSSTRSASTSQDEQHVVKSRSHDDIVFVENVHEDDEENDHDDNDKWQELSAESSSSPIPTNSQSKIDEPRRRSDDYAPNPGLIQPWLWGDQIIAHITSPIHRKMSDSTTASTRRVVNDAPSPEGGVEDNNIIWRRPDELDDIDSGDSRGKFHGNRYRNHAYHRHAIEEEYDDRNNNMAESLPWAEEDTHDDDQRWERPSQQSASSRHTTQQRTRDHDPPPRADNPSSSSSVKTKLQQTLIHDPLRSLPYCFIRHFYQEMKHQITFTWDSYRQQKELHTILAPLSLVILVSLWGNGLIVSGCTGLGTFIIRSLVQMLWSFYTWLIEYSWRMTTQLVWLSVCTLLFIGALVWVGMRIVQNRKENNESSDRHQTFQMPSVSVIIPWIIAVTSPSLVEAIAILLSLQTFASIFAPEIDDKECSALDGNEHDPFCSAADTGLEQSTPLFSYGMWNTAILSVALVVALMNIFVVSISAKMLEQHRDQSNLDTTNNVTSDAKISSSMEPQEPSSVLSRLRVHYNRIQQNIGACHTISVLALVFLTTTLVLVQTLYIHFRTNGSTVILSLINRIGTVGFNVLCIGVGVLTLFHTWNFTIMKVTGSDNVLANGISCSEISRKALQKSIVEISTHAVWSKDDTGSGLLGILSDDDGALRYAIFEWIVDRWTASPTTPFDQAAPPTAENSDDNVGHDNAEANHAHFSNNSSSDTTTNTNTSDNHQPLLPSYQSLQNVIAKLDADETLIPTIERYREWVYTLPPSQNAAMCVATWKLCPATIVLTSAVIFCVVWSAFGRLVAWFSWCFGASFASSANEGGCMIFIFAMCTILSPLLFLEYRRVQMWWICITSYMNRMNSEGQSSDVERSRDLAMTLLRTGPTFDTSQRSIDVNVLDTSELFLRIWQLLIESISVLESSIPVVRCATIASAAADLTTNTICLVDLALEIKKRGILFGVGIMVWDAFTYHLSREIEQRKQETAGEDQAHARHTEVREVFGGKYTGAVVGTVENIGKLSRNIGGLMDQKGASEKRKGVGSDDDDGTPAVEPTTTCKEAEQPAEAGEENRGKGDNKSVPSHGDGRIDASGNETKQTHPRCQGEECPMEDEGNKQDNGLMPILIGGGLAIAGAVAGLAVHAATANKGSHKRKDSR